MISWPVNPELLRRLYTSADPEALAWDLPSFLAAYTLHDSALAEVRFEQSEGLLLLIQWDMHWNPRVPPQYQNLVIRIPMIYAVQWTQGGWNQNTLAGATSEPVPADERRRMLEDGSVELRAYQDATNARIPPFEDEGLTRTVIESMNWSRLTILHAPLVHFLCLDDKGRPGPIPQHR